MEEHFGFANRIKSNIEQNLMQKINSKSKDEWQSQNNNNKKGNNSTNDIEMQIMNLENLMNENAEQEEASQNQNLYQATNNNFNASMSFQNQNEPHSQQQNTSQQRKRLDQQKYSQISMTSTTHLFQNQQAQQELRDSIKNIQINLGGSDIISSFKEQRRKQLIRDMSCITPSHLKLIRDKLFIDDKKYHYLHDINQTHLSGSGLVNQHGTHQFHTQSKDQEIERNWRFKHKQYANETQGLLQRNNKVVEQMAPALEQNKEMLKNLLIQSRRNINRSSQNSPIKKQTLTSMNLSQMFAQSPKEKQKDDNKFKVMIDAFNDEIQITQKPQPLVQKFIQKQRDDLQKKFELQVIEAFTNKNLSSARNRLTIKIERMPRRKEIDVEFLEKPSSPRKASHFVSSNNLTKFVDDEIMSPLQPKRIGQLIRKSSNVRELSSASRGSKNDKEMQLKLMKMGNISQSQPRIDIGQKQTVKVPEKKSIKTVLFTKEFPQNSNFESQQNLLLQSFESEDFRKQEDKLIQVNQQFDQWSRMLEPVFSGNCRAEINMLDQKKLTKPQNMLTKFEQDILSEYRICTEKIASKQIQKGLWEVRQCIGQLPDSRESISIVAIGKEVYLYGGYGRELFDDLRILECYGQQWKWNLIKQQNHINGQKLTATQILHTAHPGPRYASILKRYKQNLILFGGGGPYVQSIKTRTCYNDIRFFDTLEKNWFKDQRGLRGSYVPQKRLHHSGDILGCILAVYGGFNTEQKRVLDDLIMFDIEENAWIQSLIKYPNFDLPIGPRAEHSMTAVLNMRQEQYQELRWSRSLWSDPNIQKEFRIQNLDVQLRSFFKYGYFLYGGYCSKAEEALGDLWLLQPDCDFNSNQVNKKPDLESANQVYKDYKLCFKAYNISKIVKGQPPLPRYGHQAIQISKGKYLVITGGRNNQIYKKLNNIALNDICLFNTIIFQWETLAIYGSIPASRWNHGMVQIEENRLLVIGGVNTNSYMNSQIFSFEFGEDLVDSFLLKAKEICDNLKQRAKLLSNGIK
eukprot:403370142